MTDPKPDPLFDALREQLADYGQEPPAHLWAGIRQQLPPPVALPQRRRRRALSAALLALLMTVIGVVGWQAWELNPLRQRAVASQPGPPPAAETTANDLQNQADRAVAATSAAATQDAPAAAPAATTTQLAETRPSGVPSPAAAPVAAATAAIAATPAPTAAAAGAAASAAVATAGRPSGTASASAARPGRPGAVRAARTALATGSAAENSRAASPGHAVASAGAAHQSAQPAARVDASKAPALAAAATSQIRSEAARTRRARRPLAASAAAESTTTSAPAVARQPLAAPQQPALAAARAAAANDRPPTGLAAPAGPGLAHNQPRPAALPARATAGMALPVAYDQLARRQATLAEQPVPAPAAPQPLAVKHRATPHLPAARWVVQTLAGPALTSVYQGPASKIAGNVPAVIVNQVTETEQSATSGSLQFSLRHNFDAHWSLSAGLGAAAYASQSTLRQRHLPSTGTAVTPLDPLGSLDTVIVVSQYRKSYEFFTLPVRLGYAWQPTKRWQLGLLAGADAMLLSRSNEVRSLPAQPAVRLSSSADDHPFSLGTSLGLEARYHLSPRCELLAQPTFTYQLTPLKADRDGEALRHLWGAALLFGVAYELR